MTRKLSLGLIALLLLALPAPAGAVLGGENGRIVLTSARNGGANLAQLFLLPVLGESGGGPLGNPIATAGGLQHRHATWSPDRTKIAFARGVPPANFDIFIQDLTQPGSAPVQITTTPNVLDDRPAWSPDGTRIAWESEVNGQRDILLKVAPFTGATIVNFTGPNNTFEGKPAWSADSNSLFYEKGDPMLDINPLDAESDTNIMRRTPGLAEELAVSDTGVHEFQPSLSPDGKKICFSIGPKFTEPLGVFVGSATPPTLGVQVSKAGADYNCTWSPDGRFIAYSTGTFANGKLVMVKANDTSPEEIVLADGAGFDGNPDWAPDGRPECPDLSLTTTVGTPVKFSVTCTDTGPAYERSLVQTSILTQPANGSATQENETAGAPITYTPNQGAIGTDTFQVRAHDLFGFSPDLSTITVTIQPAPKPPEKPKDDDGNGGDGGQKPLCGGKRATIVGKAGAELIVGTKRNDVIAALGGNDRVRGGAGNDIICGGAGSDRISGQAGNDTLIGDGGKDTLLGNGGLDKLRGGPGKDPCTGGGGRDSASSCELPAGIP